MGVEGDELERLARRVREAPGSAAFVEWAEELRRAGRSEEALQVLREGFRVHPDHAPARVVLARVHRDAGRRQHALDVLAEVLRLDPDQGDALALLSELRAQAGRRLDEPGASDPFARLEARARSRRVHRSPRTEGAGPAPLEPPDGDHRLARWARSVWRFL